MFKRFILHIVIVLSALNLATVYAKDDSSRTPPKPLENKLFDSMVGTWTGESDMMGVKMNDTLNISWSLNHQYLIVKLDAKNPSKPEQHYEGLGLFGQDPTGTIKSWWFDSWGAKSAATGSGKIQNNQLVINDGSPHFKEQRSFQVDGNQMTMHAKGNMIVDGKTTPFEQTVVYKK
jgi:hypothetical protein